MIVGHEGQPRSGKSFEAVKFHLLEALRAQRRVYVRINGIDHEKIAAYLEMPLEVVQDKLMVLDDNLVHEWLVCDTEPDGSLVFPHIDRGALVIIDEVHEYWPVGRAALPERVSQFFAKHGHIGLDVVLMTQDFKEVHRSVVRRMQRKNLYTKLDALGKDESYSVRFYTASTPGKFELMGSEKRDYDPAIYPLYHGIQPGVESQKVYKSGSKTLWQTAKKPAILVALALVLGIGALVRFFVAGGSDAIDKAAMRSVPSVGAAPRVASPVPQAVSRVVEKPKPPKPAGIQYLLDLREDARPRFAGSYGEENGRELVLLEFRQDGSGGRVVERLTRDQVEALGWKVKVTKFGAYVGWKDDVIIFTAWPVDPPMQQSVRTAENIERAGPPVLSASESQPALAPSYSAPSGSDGSQAQQATYGGFRGG